MEREIIWIGSSLKDMRRLPEDVQDEIDDITPSSGNVFADMAMHNPVERKAKANLAMLLNQAIEKRQLSAQQSAHILGISVEMRERVARGRLRNVSLEQLLHWLIILDHHVTITVSSAAMREHYIPLS